MANMSYCRFSNTVDDLDDCYDALAEGDFEELSTEEQRAAIRLVKMCRNLAEDFEDNIKDWELINWKSEKVS